MKFSSIESALFGLYNLAGASRYKTTDFSKLNELKGLLIVESVIPNEKIVIASVIIHEIEKLCTETELAFLRVFYGFYDKRYSDRELNTLARLINNRCPDVVKLCILAYRDPNSRNYGLYRHIMELTGLSYDVAKNKAHRTKDKLKELCTRFMNTDYKLAHKIENILLKNELINFN
jgi:hypothetical protein